MSADIDPTKAKVKEICKQLRPILGPKMDKLWRAYCFSDDKQRKDLETYLEMLSSKFIQEDLSKETIILVPPSQEESSGSYYFGDIEYNNKLLYPFGLREYEWNQHMAVLGRSGSGKTNFGFLIVKELLKHNKDLLIFDWKRNYRDLLSIPGFDKLKVYTVGRSDNTGNPIAPLKFNPLIPPPNVNPKTWLKLLIEVIAHAYFLGEGVAYILQMAIDSAYRKSSIYEGNTTTYPTFRDILIWLRAYNPKGREINWLSSTMRAVSSLCFGEMDKVVNIDNNIGLETLLKEKAILELDSLIVSDRILIVETLLLWIYQYRLSSATRDSSLSHALVIEEAHHILSQQKRNLSGGETIMETVFRQCRELNEAIVILDQQPSQLSSFSLANTYTAIVMNLKHKKDVEMVNKFLLLDGKQEDYPIRLSLGQAIVKLQDRIQNSFLIRVPEFPITKGVITDEFLRRKIELPKLTYTLSDKERHFLADIQAFPEASVVQRYQRLSLGAREGTLIKEGLISKGLIEQQDLITPTSRIKQLRLTELGMKEIKADDEFSG
jgi:hypothetical protein